MKPDIKLDMKPDMKPDIKKKLIALDIDGTIIDKPTGIPVPRAVREAVQGAREAGARVCLCSSRPCFYMRDATDGLLGVDALIGCSGAVIEIPEAPGGARGEMIFMDEMPQALVLAVFEAAKKRDLYMSFAIREKLLVAIKGPVNPPPADASVFSVLEDAPLLLALREEPVSCAVVFTEEGMEDDVIFDEPSLAGATIQRSASNCFVITNKGTDKGTGLTRLAGLWGVSREGILAVGNDENDVPMFEAAGVAVAVENAGPEAIAAADWVAPHVRDGGAAEAIRRFML